ncbi:MAG: Wzz/FepE/Etk N-terminal domain-containing protein, partial [Gemmataceae bacterium]
MDDFVYPYDNAEREFAEPHFRRVFDVVRRHRRKIVVAAIFGIILLFFGSLVIPPEYTAKAQIVLETQAIDPAESTPPISQGSEEAAIQTEVTALTSHAFLKRVMNNLSRDPDYQAAALQEPANIHGFGNVLWLEFGAWFRHKVAQLVVLLRPRGKTARAPEQQRLDSFTREIKVYQDHSSDVIAVTFRATSPRQAAIAANQLTLLYIAGTEHRRRAQAQQVLARLDNRIREAKMALQRTETAAQNYRLVQGLADNKEGSLLDQKLTDLTRKLVALETGLAQRQAKLVAGRALQSRGSDAVVESLGSPADVELLRREIALQQSKAETASWAR